MKFQPFLLLLFAAYGSTQKSECPSDENVYPCRCETDDSSYDIVLYCTDASISLKEVKSALSHLSGKKNVKIELRDLDIGTVPSKLFEGIDVRELFFHRCKIESFEDGSPALSSLEDSLEILYIWRSFTQKTTSTKLKFGHLKKLQILTVSYNVITEISDDWFADGYSSLRSLHLDDNVIKKIGEKAFEKLTNLYFFSLSGNKIGSFRRSMLPSPANRLQILDLNKNGFESIPDDLFSFMPSLTIVWLNLNDLKTLDRKAWEPVLEQLDSIYLEGNIIQCDSDMDWLFDMKVTPTIHGKCEGPEGKEGLTLTEFLKGHH